MDERDFGGIALIGKHTFAEEGAFQRDAIEPADHAVARPNFDGVAGALLKQFAIERTDALVDPRRVAAGARRGAAVDNALVVAIDADLQLR